MSNVKSKGLVGPVRWLCILMRDPEEWRVVGTTDEHTGYMGLDGLLYKHEAVCHSTGEYVRGNVSTNGIESVWAVLKRGLHGVYHHASKKHLARYIDEFTFRLNDGNVKRHTLDRLACFVDAVAGRRLTYKELTA